MAKKKDYNNYTKEQLIAELKKLNKRKKYGLVWEEDKTKEKFEAQAEGKLPVLVEETKREIKTTAHKPTHILIEGDNYHALSVLNYTHAKSIDVIYIDPPYNTGNNDFKYNDKFVDREDSYRHSKWLSFMRKRLKLAKNLLKTAGVIYISIDDNEVSQLKLLCDDIFGEENNVAINVWEKIHSTKNDARYLSVNHEYILLYTKNKSKIVISLLKRTNEMNSRYKNPDNDPRGAWQSGDLVANEIRKEGAYEVKNPKTKKVFTVPNGKHWVYSKENMLQLIKDNKIWFGKEGNAFPRKKRFLSEVIEGRKASTLWKSEEVGHNQEGKRALKNFFGQTDDLFSTPKPVRLIKRILDLSSKDNSIVLDFFAGSGTTAQAVLELNKEDKGNRQFILVTNNEGNICTKICYPRVKKVIKGYKNTKGQKVKGLGGNLKYYKTDFVGAEPTHRNKKLLTDKSIEMLCLKENTFNEVLNKKYFSIFKSKVRYTAILFNELKMEQFKKEIKKLKLPISIYVFSLEGDDFREEFVESQNDITLCSIPEAILKVYRRIYGTDKIKSK
ncbi:site-specific DNA-methyltransferase [Candidatus Woesearchaeota archaeon]|nr:site-specific DNA-methyltransferase [Candidatus Woesearchaeota archaeon]